MKVSTEWSPELAYAVGLITTDGCLSIDGRHLDFTSKDRQLINTFKTCLGLQHLKNGLKMSGYSDKKCYRVQIGDVHFYRWLQKIDLMPKKSRTLVAVKIQEQFFFDFLRGCFDGDGTIYSFWDRRWADSFMFYIAFASGSKTFLTWLPQKLKLLLRLTGHITPAYRDTYQLKYAKQDSIALFRAMFYGKNPPLPSAKIKKGTTDICTTYYNR